MARSNKATEAASERNARTPFPKLAQPALRALAGAGYDHLEKLAGVQESSLRELHGIGPIALVKLRDALHHVGLSFAAPTPADSAPNEIDDYIAGFPAEVQATLQKVRKTIRIAAPEAEEIISYRMPAFRQHGILVYFAAWKVHVGLYPPISGDKALEKAVARYAGPKGNLQFPLDELAAVGYRVVGVDISAAMIEIACQRVPDVEFHVESFLRFPIPPCRAITALGEVFSYLFDADNSLRSLEVVCRKAVESLSPGGLLIFDVAGPERSRGRTQAFTEGDDWTCLVEYQHDERTHRLTRRIVTFRRVDDAYRRQEEVHHQQLFETATVVQMLERAGFAVRMVRGYGDHALAEGVTGFVARRS